MAIPTLAGFTAGEKVTAAKLNLHTKTAIEESVYYKPYCHLTHATTQSFTSSASTKVNLTSIIDDTGSMADTANNQIKIVTAGVYRLTAQVRIAANGTGNRYGEIQVNGTPVVATSGPSQATWPASFQISKTVRLAALATVSLFAIQTSGVSLNSDITFGGMFLQAEFIRL